MYSISDTQGQFKGIGTREVVNGCRNETEGGEEKNTHVKVTITNSQSHILYKVWFTTVWKTVMTPDESALNL